MLYIALALSAILIATAVVQSATIATPLLDNAMLDFRLAASSMIVLSAALNSPSFAIAFSALTLLTFATFVPAAMTTTASGGNSWGTLIQFRFNRFYSRFLRNAARCVFKRNYALHGALFTSGTLRTKSFFYLTRRMLAKAAALSSRSGYARMLGASLLMPS